MTPAELSVHLRKIAAAIDASKNPDRGRVAAELNKVLASVRLASAATEIAKTITEQSDLRAWLSNRDNAKATIAMCDEAAGIPEAVEHFKKIHGDENWFTGKKLIHQYLTDPSKLTPKACMVVDRIAQSLLEANEPGSHPVWPH